MAPVAIADRPRVQALSPTREERTPDERRNTDSTLHSLTGRETIAGGPTCLEPLECSPGTGVFWSLARETLPNRAAERSAKTRCHDIIFDSWVAAGGDPEKLQVLHVTSSVDAVAGTAMARIFMRQGMATDDATCEIDAADPAYQDLIMLIPSCRAHLNLVTKYGQLMGGAYVGAFRFDALDGHVDLTVFLGRRDAGPGASDARPHMAGETDVSSSDDMHVAVKPQRHVSKMVQTFEMGPSAVASRRPLAAATTQRRPASGSISVKALCGKFGPR